MNGMRTIRKCNLVSIMPFCLMLLLLSSCTAYPQSKRDMKTPPPWGVCRSIAEVDKIQAAGYSYVEEGVGRFLIPLESDEAFQEKLKAAEQSPLPIYSCNGFIPGELKSTGPATNHDEILTFAETAFKRAQQIGIRVIVFGSGGSRKLPKGFPYEKGTDQFIQLLKAMGPIAAQYGVTVVIEPLNKDECNFINSVKEGADIANAANHPNIAVLADIYHMAKENEGPESIRYAGKLIKHCHVAELVGRKMPGTNNYDFTPYFKALMDIHYQGNISLEGKWDDFDAQLVPVMTYLNDQWAKANEKGI